MYLLITLIAALVANGPQDQNATRIAAEEKAVYRVLIEDLLQRAGNGRAAHVAIRRTTTTGPRRDPNQPLEQELRALVAELKEGTASVPAPEASLRASFVASNRTPHAVPADLGLSVPVAIDDFDLSPRDFWTQFARKYPGSAGIIGLSGVGFNDTHTRALVYREHIEAPRAASGELVLLAHDARGWHIEKTFPLWMS
jgi:hypothetical protein